MVVRWEETPNQIEMSNVQERFLSVAVPEFKMLKGSLTSW